MNVWEKHNKAKSSTFNTYEVPDIFSL